MSTKTEKARELFLEGYNCAQSVVGAFCEDVGLDFETAIKLSSSFGGGMGRLREVCGAISGAFMIAGLKFGYLSPIDNKPKAEHYKLIQNMAAKFREENGSIICRELIGKEGTLISHIPSERTEEFYKTRPCTLLVERAAAIVEEMLEGKLN